MSDETSVPEEVSSVNEQLAEVSEQVVQDAVAPKPKQYLLMADEATMIFMGKLMPSMLFVQVEGIAMQGDSNYMVLVNPVKKEPSIDTIPQEVNA